MPIPTGVALISHDDASPEQRRWFRSLGCRVSEFPMNMETAREAAAADDAIVLGAPNVMRGKSHMGWVNASEMISHGLCSVLASDYYYPAPLVAAFRLAETGVAPLEQAWSLVSASPARAVGLVDRGSIARGLRADLILVDPEPRGRPRLVGVLVAVLVFDVVVFRGAVQVSSKLDASRMLVTEKVFGFLLAALGVQLVLDGLSDVGVIHLTTGH